VDLEGPHLPRTPPRGRHRYRRPGAALPAPDRAVFVDQAGREPDRADGEGRRRSRDP
jgi:hypothetical protein